MIKTHKGKLIPTGSVREDFSPEEWKCIDELGVVPLEDELYYMHEVQILSQQDVEKFNEYFIYQEDGSVDYHVLSIEDSERRSAIWLNEDLREALK